VDSMLNERLRSLLADPDAMERVMEMAGNLLGGDAGAGLGEKTAEEKETPPSSPSPSAVIGQALAGGGGENDRIRLLSALCPFLNPQRRQAAGAMIRILRLLSLADGAGLFKQESGGT